VTDLVNREREGNILHTPFLRLVQCTQSIVLTVQGGSAVTGDIFMCFVLAKPRAIFKQTDAMSWFPPSPGSAEAQVR